MESNVENLTALTLPCFNIDKLTVEMPIISESSFNFIFRFANMTSKFTTIAIIKYQAFTPPAWTAM
mgnify:CR=1 FL=1